MGREGLVADTKCGLRECGHIMRGKERGIKGISK